MNKNSNFLVINQAIVDTSLEIKSALETFQKISLLENRSKMNIKISIDEPEIKNVEDQSAEHETKEIKIHYFIEGTLEEQTIFIIEIVHSGLVQCINVTEEQKDFFFKKEYLLSITPYLYCAAIDVLKSSGLHGIFIPPIELINFTQATIIGHHTKDISFQVNCPPQVLAEIKQDHKEKRNVGIDFSIQSKSKPMDSKALIGEEMEIVEMEISSKITANYNKNLLCTCDILYSVVVKINEMEEKFKEKFLSFDCPRLFFPFIVAFTNKAFMDAGLGKINIPPIDFNRIIIQTQNNKNKSDN